jgi:hypothetical protein
MLSTSLTDICCLGCLCRILAIWARERSGAGRAGPIQPHISWQVGASTFPTIDVEDQYVVLLYWKPQLGCMCVKAARAVAPWSSSQSIKEFITRKGRVAPGKIMPVKYDMLSELRSSKGFASGDLSLSTPSTLARLGHFIALENLLKAFTCAFLILR